MLSRNHIKNRLNKRDWYHMVGYAESRQLVLPFEPGCPIMTDKELLSRFLLRIFVIDREPVQGLWAETLQEIREHGSKKSQ